MSMGRIKPALLVDHFDNLIASAINTAQEVEEQLHVENCDWDVSLNQRPRRKGQASGSRCTPLTVPVYLPSSIARSIQAVFS